MTKRILTILLLASVLFITFAITNSVKAAESESKYATVKPISNCIITGNGSEKVTVKYENIEKLKYSKANPSIGRMQGTWWLGVKIYAPKGMTREQLDKVEFVRGGETKLFMKVEDSARDADEHYFEAWVPVNKLVLANAKNGASIMDYAFDWDNDGTMEQNISVFLDPDTITLNTDGVVSIIVGNRVFTIEEGKTLKDGLTEYEYNLLQKQSTPAEGKKFVGFFTKDGKQVKEDDAITGDIELTPIFENIVETPDDDEPTKDEPTKDEPTKDESTKDEQTEEEQTKEEQSKEKDDTPKTGITDVIGYVAIATVVSAIGIVVLNKKH